MARIADLKPCPEPVAYAIYIGVAGCAVLSGWTVLDTLRYLRAQPFQPGIEEFEALASHEHMSPETLARTMDNDFADMPLDVKRRTIRQHEYILEVFRKNVVRH